MLGVGLLSLLVWLLRAVALALPAAPWISMRILAADLLVAVLAGLLVLLVATGLGTLLRRRIPAPFLAVLLAAVVLVGTMSPGISLLGWAWIALITLVAGAVLGGWIGRLLARGRARSGEVTGQRGGPGRAHTVMAAVVAVATVGTIGGLLYPGSPATGPAPARSGTAAIDPSQPGPFAVRQFSYGAGRATDPARYGTEVSVTTETIDAAELLPRWQPDGIRTQLWGFDASALPLNATVWAPEGTEPAPLVLLLHGNAQHADSELGLGYLAEHLASRGYVVASIDQSFLNTGLLDRTGGLPHADQLRGWLVRQHVAQWSRWMSSGAEQVPAVDLDSVVLLGHSRGGEAVTVAAATAEESAAVERSGITLPAVDLAGVTISTVVTLAPSDGLIVPDPLTLSGVDYLTIAGTHDADIGTFAGARQYHRADPRPEGLRAAALLHRGNHTQFNTLWGRRDAGAGLASRVLNTAVLLSPEQQQQTTAALVAAFLDASVHHDQDARDLFTQPLPQAPWLPPAQVRIASTLGDRTPLASVAELRVSGATAQVVPLPSRMGPTDHEVLHLQSDQQAARVEVPTGAIRATSTLQMAAADAAPAGVRSTSPTVHLVGTDTHGTEARCAPVTIPPMLNGQVGKLALLVPRPDSEPFLETVRWPLTCLADAGVEVTSLETLHLVVQDAGPAGVYLDELSLVG